MCESEVPDGDNKITLRIPAGNARLFQALILALFLLFLAMLFLFLTDNGVEFLFLAVFMLINIAWFYYALKPRDEIVMVNQECMFTRGNLPFPWQTKLIDLSRIVGVYQGRMMAYHSTLTQGLFLRRGIFIALQPDSQDRRRITKDDLYIQRWRLMLPGNFELMTKNSQNLIILGSRASEETRQSVYSILAKRFPPLDLEKM
jgi:hypothetical protein